MVTEVGRPVVGYEGIYEVSSMGRVRSLERDIVERGGKRRHWTSQTLMLHLTEKGYHQVYLQGGRQRRLHQLVAEAFLGPCPPGCEVRHRNGDHGDSRLLNLEYGTRSQNVRDAIEHGTHNHASKVACPFGHRLVDPNLVESQVARGIRACKACHRARAAVQRNPQLDYRAEADRRYAQIMPPEAS